jgi:hypothetical protein
MVPDCLFVEFISLFIPQINKYLLSTYYVTDITLDSEDTIVNICIVVG